MAHIHIEASYVTTITSDNAPCTLMEPHRVGLRTVHARVKPFCVVGRADTQDSELDRKAVHGCHRRFCL